MLIWLRNSKVPGDGSQHGAAVTDDVLRGEHVASLVTIDEAYRDLNQRCDALLDEARLQAQALFADAQAEANDLIEQAEATYAGAHDAGYSAGWQQSLADWHERNLRSQAEAPSIGQRQRDRLAQLVALAVEQIVFSADPVAIFRQAAASVEQIVADGSPLKARVHPDDLAAATTAFDDVSRVWREAGRLVRVQVSADAQLEPGTCVCETDLGAMDSSLPQQLAAINAALSRAVGSLPQDEADESDEPGDLDQAPWADAEQAYAELETAGLDAA